MRQRISLSKLPQGAYLDNQSFTSFSWIFNGRDLELRGWPQNHGTVENPVSCVLKSRKQKAETWQIQNN